MHMPVYRCRYIYIYDPVFYMGHFSPPLNSNFTPLLFYRLLSDHREIDPFESQCT